MGVGAAIGGIAAGVGSIAAGRSSAKASKRASGEQLQATRESIAEQRRQFDQTRSDLAPFRQAGTGAVDDLTSLVTDPEAQRDFITDNPFFTALADDAQDRIFSNKAARGKLGSGETAEALQNSILLLGEDLLSNRINQTQNLVNTGLGAATRTGQFGAQSASTIADLRSQGANAQAAGIVGAANARTQGIQNTIGTGLNIFALNRMFPAGGQ